MEPNACLALIVSLYGADDNRAMEEALEDLAQWLIRGGFAPSARPLGSVDTTWIGSGNCAILRPEGSWQFKVYHELTGRCLYTFDLA
jgi:hypothetical protein